MEREKGDNQIKALPFEGHVLTIETYRVESARSIVSGYFRGAVDPQLCRWKITLNALNKRLWSRTLHQNTLAGFLKALDVF